MRRGLIVMALAAAGPALGQAVQTGACEVEQPLDEVLSIATCEVTNLASTSVVLIRYGFRLVQDGRELPWASDGFSAGQGFYSVAIPDGIEPGKTVPVVCHVKRMPEGADPALVRYEIEALEARDVNGTPVR